MWNLECGLSELLYALWNRAREEMVNLKRTLFNLYFYIVPKAATKWLNFQFDIAEALDNLERDES